MAAKNVRHQRNSGSAGAVTGAGTDDASAIRELIDGDGSGPADGENGANGDASGGSKRDSGSSERESSGSRKGSSRSERKSAGSGSSSDASGTGDTRRTGDHSRNAGRNADATSETRETGDVLSRKELTPKRPKVDAEKVEIPGTTKEIIANGYQSIFWIIGQVTGLSEVWELDDDGAEVLGDSTEAFFKSLGPKKAKSFVKGIGKVGPSLVFAGSLGMAIVPRVKATVTAAKNGTIKPPKERKSAPPSSGNPDDATTSSGHSDTGKSGAIDPASLRAVPFTSADFAEIVPGFNQSDAGIDVS